MRKTALIAEDNPVDREIMLQMLENLDISVKSCADGSEVISIMKSLMKTPETKPDIVLLDLNMPGIDGISTLGHIKSAYPEIPVIIITSSDEVEDAVQVMKLGAADFLNKPISQSRLEVSVNNVLRLNELSHEVKRLRKVESGLVKFEDIIGHDSGLTRAVEIARKAAHSDTTILLTGESGVGKELFANAIHGESKRVGKPFIAINCGAIPKNLVESILFGHEKGSFTGAISKSLGKFREAAGGTIFLDEIGELPADVQVKLLRVIQNREIEPVGLGKSVYVDVRIVSATNRNLSEEVRKGNFREDLFYRLSTLQIQLPALRERPEDIPALASYFISKFSAAENKPIYKLEQKTLDKLMKYQWPGNVRELENVISRSVILSSGTNLDIDDFGIYTLAPRDYTDSIKLYDDAGRVKPIELVEEEIINFFLSRFGNKVDKVAELLGISKATIYRRLQKSA